MNVSAVNPVNYKGANRREGSTVILWRTQKIQHHGFLFKSGIPSRSMLPPRSSRAIFHSVTTGKNLFTVASTHLYQNHTDASRRKTTTGSLSCVAFKPVEKKDNVNKPSNTSILQPVATLSVSSYLWSHPRPRGPHLVHIVTSF